MENINWNKYLKEALDRTDFMALATVSDNGSWVCPVQFSYDPKLNLFFKSMPSSKHMQDIKNNLAVSVAIFSTNRLPSGEVVGIQLQGQASILDNPDEVLKAAKYHYGRSQPSIDPTTRVEEHLGQEAAWNFVSIVPTEAWYFNSELFDEETEGRQKIPLEQINL